MQEGYFLCTPKKHIKLGEICRDDSGSPALLVKRGKKDEYEKVPIEWFLALFPQFLDTSILQNPNHSE